jgi:hypothetical protein
MARRIKMIRDGTPKGYRRVETREEWQSTKRTVYSGPNSQQLPREEISLHPLCDVCGWRKGGMDSWDGVTCKCGHLEPPIEKAASDSDS